MKKKVLSLVLALALCLGLAVPALAAGGFADVEEGAYYAEAVDWAVKLGITSGTSETTFSPDRTCTRGEIITFLWRMGADPDDPSQPEPKGTIGDVAESSFCYKAVLWAKEKGAFEGDLFYPNAPCTRLMAVELMWKCFALDPTIYESPRNQPDAGFSDVDSPAVNWAVARGFVTGTSETTFSPDMTCTRGQIVTMLHRDRTLTPLTGKFISETGIDLPGGRHKDFVLILSDEGDWHYKIFFADDYDRTGGSDGALMLGGTLKKHRPYYGYGEQTRMYFFKDYLVFEEKKPHIQYFSGKFIPAE